MAARPATPRSRRLGLTLLQQRTAKGLSQEQVAAAMRCSPAKISRQENGTTLPTPGDVMELLSLYDLDATSALYQQMVSLAREARETNWWNAYGATLSGHYTKYIAYEDEAEWAGNVQLARIPGQLQTREYAAEVIGVRWRHEPDRHARLVAARLERQDLLRKPDRPLKLTAIISEAALRTDVGGPAVMSAQLDHLVQVCQQQRNIELQVLPFTTGAHLAESGPFALLAFGAGEPGLGYLETPGGEMFVEKPEEIQHLHDVFAQLRHLALPPTESLGFITEFKEQHYGPQ
ncbi:transcriptional regulator with XRE-family HTH domain [Catenuloplanes nepalensis]|uniref:Transcriptional regulator with XRE-family HTH domain n=1 Tax=Catenuloplanes nepalensis TaxID=587533 RepID=A0ABT9MM21_9ACTN|nr:helix-turn-helix transcriptional regulator [Catenuloplanes nepalensis]MDP9792467.1 transcriptional regulator with XRE-family HTH domain [Catenuloplanes nepalensis]